MITLEEISKAEILSMLMLHIRFAYIYGNPVIYTIMHQVPVS